MKAKAGASPQASLTPPCTACGQDHIGLQVDSFMMLRGVWMESTEHGAPVFLVDPDTQYVIIKAKNKQLLITDPYGADTGYAHPTIYAHKECLEDLFKDRLDDFDSLDDCEDEDELDNVEYDELDLAYGE